MSFKETLEKCGLTLVRVSPQVVQVNVGKLCNQACRHCHVDAGPKRTEVMSRKTVDRIIELLRLSPEIRTVDITGGAPELNPHFRHLVEGSLGKEVIDRCNLTVLFEPGQERTAEFLREFRVKIVASLPCYSKENVERSRGAGVFDKSIQALKLLNSLGYGKDDDGLVLDLVYNPSGPFLPPPEKDLENEYKRKLKEYGITFNKLYAITNLPIRRFLQNLKKLGKLEEYMALLVENFNPEAAKGIMCRSLISVGWDGNLYDCDFNQMLEIPLGGRARTIWDIGSFSEISSGEIVFGSHCFGCTAGSGSSCSGTLLRKE
ncbi:MAG: arsenosugar biosynthesis radical SAM protein ArsS [Deltaproteobacteria bacterium]|nr:arsenosugar biosynthesis radical SAM protein ArsS [Deltaproteobacteria bacterium]